MAEVLATRKITDAEWEVMRVIWANGGASSRLIVSVLEEKMSWKASTIKTLISRLVDKGLLAAEKEGRKFIYSAVLTENENINDFTSDLLSKVCNKKEGQVVRDSVQEAQLSQSDIDDLIALLKAKRETALEEVPCNCVPGQCECHLNLGGEINE